MTSQIDATKPAGPVAYTADVRANFAAAKAEIEALEATLAVDQAGNLTIAVTGGITISANSITLDAPAFTHLGATFGPDPQQAPGVYGVVAEGFDIAANGPSDGGGFWFYSLDNPTGSTVGVV
jgi:hypothetical protein